MSGGSGALEEERQCDGYVVVCGGWMDGYAVSALLPTSRAITSSISTAAEELISTQQLHSMYVHEESLALFLFLGPQVVRLWMV